MKEHLKEKLELNSYPSNWVIRRLLRNMKYSYKRSTAALEQRNNSTTINTSYNKCLQYSWIIKEKFTVIYLDETAVDQLLIPYGGYSKQG